MQVILDRAHRHRSFSAIAYPPLRFAFERAIKRLDSVPLRNLGTQGSGDWS